ncbi:MAG TPA: family 20 glycosylhydrolase [Acidimicrobiales bacterium]
MTALPRAIVLLPMPRQVELTGEVVPFRPAVHRIDQALPAQGYVLEIGADGVAISGADQAALFYGETTLNQLAAVEAGSLPAGVIRDHPDQLVRGVMLDISRDKVPTMATLRALIDRLAAMKVNHFELYSEHTFAYQHHGDVHGAASPLSAAEISELATYCAERHIELTPNQNCLGHMNRWLAHDRYRPLAICPDGFTDPFGMKRQPMTIEPTNPDSLTLVRQLLAELLPLFSSRRVHVGLDEAWELPHRRIDDFMAWVRTLRALPELEGREMLMWGDMLLGHPDSLRDLPEGVTICEWGYDEDHPYEERCAALAAAGVPFWVAPGTSSWTSVLGRLTNMAHTCASAARAGLAHGAVGYLNTDWGDQGHLQQAIVSDPGFAYGAAVSWCLETNESINLAAALSAHVFDDPSGGLAAALLRLGDLHRLVTPQFPNMSAVVSNLYYPQLPVGRSLTEGLTLDELDAVDDSLDQARDDAERSASHRSDADQLGAEVRFSIDLVSLLVRDARARMQTDGHIGSVPETVRLELASELGALIERYRTLWLARNRPGGLSDSLSWLENLRSAYETGRPDPTWGGLPAPK